MICTHPDLGLILEPKGQRSRSHGSKVCECQITYNVTALYLRSLDGAIINGAPVSYGAPTDRRQYWVMRCGHITPCLLQPHQLPFCWHHVVTDWFFLQAVDQKELSPTILGDSVSEVVVRGIFWPGNRGKKFPHSGTKTGNLLQKNSQRTRNLTFVCCVATTRQWISLVLS